MIADSSIPDKLRNVYALRNTARNVTIQKRKVYYIKIKVIAFIIILEETNPFAIERCKSNKRTIGPVAHLRDYHIVSSWELN